MQKCSYIVAGQLFMCGVASEFVGRIVPLELNDFWL